MKPLIVRCLFLCLSNFFAALRHKQQARGCLHILYWILLNIPIRAYLNDWIRLKPIHRAFTVKLLKDGEGPRQKRDFFKTPVARCWLTWPSRNSDNKLREENLHLNVIIYSLLPWSATRNIGHAKGLHGNTEAWVSERMPSCSSQDWLVLPSVQKSDNLSVSESVHWNSKPTDTTESFPGGR